MTKYNTSGVHHRRQCHHQQEQEQDQNQHQQQQHSLEGGDVFSERSSRISLVEIVRRFGRQTSMHGVPNAIEAHHLMAYPAPA